MSFQILPLPATGFAHLYGRSDEELRAAGILSYVADAPTAFPCRVSLADADPGDRLLLVNYEHQPAETPYRSRHAIFVRDWAEEAKPEADEIPAMLSSRLLSVRSFDEPGLMIEADVVEGQNAADAFEAMRGNKAASYLHVHTAKQGCYLAKVVRT